MDTPNVHPCIEPLRTLLGVWRGDGHGSYPTISDFDYADEWEFTQIGKPFVRFTERTHRADGTPMHTEVGYLRCVSGGRVEIVAALPTGQTELGYGEASLSDGSLSLVTDAQAQNTETAKTVDRIVRRFTVTGDALTYDMEMAAVGVGLTLHLTARLTRETP